MTLKSSGINGDYIYTLTCEKLRGKCVISHSTRDVSGEDNPQAYAVVELHKYLSGRAREIYEGVSGRDALELLENILTSPMGCRRVKCDNDEGGYPNSYLKAAILREDDFEILGIKYTFEQIRPIFERHSSWLVRPKAARF